MKSMTSLRGSVLHFQAIYDEPLNIFFKYSRTNRYFLNNDFVWIAYVYMHWIMLLFLFRVTCRESYFISELLSTMKDNLQQIKPLEFQVHTVNFSPPSSKTSDSEAIIHSLSKRSHDNGADHSDENHCTKRLCGEQDKSTPTGSESDPQKEVPYILDIDLDFFSTMNPFKDVYNERQYNILKDLYRYTPPTDSSDEVRKITYRWRNARQIYDLNYCENDLHYRSRIFFLANVWVHMTLTQRYGLWKYPWTHHPHCTLDARKSRVTI